jgi:hypothetical protein
MTYVIQKNHCKECNPRNQFTFWQNLTTRKREKKGCLRYVCDLTIFVNFNVTSIMRYNFLCKHLEKIFNVFGGYIMSSICILARKRGKLCLFIDIRSIPLFRVRCEKPYLLHLIYVCLRSWEFLPLTLLWVWMPDIPKLDYHLILGPYFEITTLEIYRTQWWAGHKHLDIYFNLTSNMFS